MSTKIRVYLLFTLYCYSSTIDFSLLSFISGSKSAPSVSSASTDISTITYTVDTLGTNALLVDDSLSTMSAANIVPIVPPKPRTRNSGARAVSAAKVCLKIELNQNKINV